MSRYYEVHDFAVNVECPKCKADSELEYGCGGTADYSEDYQCPKCNEWLHVTVTDYGCYDEDGHLEVSVKVYLYTDYYGEPHMSAS